MKARGILYSAEMIRAKLEGRKTMTRRMSGLKSINVRHRYIGNSNELEIPRLAKKYDESLYYAFEDNWGGWHVVTCPFGKVGDILYAKETYTILDKDHIIEGPYVYRADATPDTEEFRLDYIKSGRPYQWKPSIFMPREAARIIDVITGIKVERLQDISTEDIIKEGIKIHTPVPGDGEPMPKLQFKNLWISINGEESWHSNPWVWVIETRNITTKGWSDIPQTS